jgi:hypothetical protein
MFQVFHYNVPYRTLYIWCQREGCGSRYSRYYNIKECKISTAPYNVKNPNIIVTKQHQPLPDRVESGAVKVAIVLSVLQ